MKQKRRDFIKTSALATGGFTLATSTGSYASVLGANDRINVAVVGIRSRGNALIGSVYEFRNTSVAALCDVDSNVLKERTAGLKAVEKKKPQTERDFRKILENKNIDAVIIASPDHTHTPFAIYALQAGKHVYLEKPLSHNPKEGFMLIDAQKQSRLKVQIGNQQRSAPSSIQAKKDIEEGIIGKAHTAKAWYTNNRGGIGTGKKVVAPEWLDWDLWQGPAPRRDYQDNIVHYNWHWFWHWGTGEVNNNGFHELDICRWMLDVDHPTLVTSSGGRHFYDDDWEFYDTQYITYNYPDDKMITWEGHSCNNLQLFDRGRGSIIYGNEGSILLDRNGYFAYDRGGNQIKEVLEENKSATTDLVGAGPLVNLHLGNFFNSIREGEKLNSPVEDINFSNHMCHLANMAQQHGTALRIDQKTGKVTNHEKAMQFWERTYQPGWEPA